MAQQNGNPNIPDLQIPPTGDSAQRQYSIATLGVHGDDAINEATDVAPALHVSTTFRYSHNPDELVPSSDIDFLNREPASAVTGDSHIYSRATAPNTSRLELMLSQIIGQPSLTYASGLAAFHALLVWTHPKVVAIGDGYHGCHGVLDIYKKLTGCKVVDLFDEKSWDEVGLGEGDVIHVETPVNPLGTSYDLAAFKQKATQRGAILTVDATFGPPPLQDPFKQGADFVMHSGTKYFGGHSDMLCGIIAISRSRADWKRDYWGMFGERLHLGAVMGSMEGWLGVRSLRTFALRVQRQSANATNLVAFLAECLDPLTSGDAAKAIRATVAKVEHSSLQTEDLPWLKKQMPGGFGPVFALWMKNETLARRLPSTLSLFHHATSLGGVESLIEWRRMSDSGVDPRLERVSVGVESWEDLRDDLVEGFKRLAAEA